VPTGFWWGNLRERYHLEDLSVDGMVLFKCILSKYDGCLELIDLAQGRDM
jgi:hypothetical protein